MGYKHNKRINVVLLQHHKQLRETWGNQTENGSVIVETEAQSSHGCCWLPSWDIAMTTSLHVLLKWTLGVKFVDCSQFCSFVMFSRLRGTTQLDHDLFPADETLKAWSQEYTEFACWRFDIWRVFLLRIILWKWALILQYEQHSFISGFCSRLWSSPIWLLFRFYTF